MCSSNVLLYLLLIRVLLLLLLPLLPLLLLLILLLFVYACTVAYPCIYSYVAGLFVHFYCTAEIGSSAWPYVRPPTFHCHKTKPAYPYNGIGDDTEYKY